MRYNRLALAMLAASAAAVGLIVALLHSHGLLTIGDVPDIVSIALPVFLLTALSYWMIRRETRLLSQLGARMDEVGKAYGLEAIDSGPATEFRRFIERFDRFLQLVNAKVHELDQQGLEAQTASRLLAYKHEKAEAVLDAIPEGVLVIDRSGVPAFANPKVEPLLGVSRQELIGQPAQKWCTNKEVLSLLMRFTQATDPAVHAEGIEFSPAEHPDRRTSVSFYPLFSPRDRATHFGLLVVFRDISREYVAKQAGAEFVAQVSHELKTPFSVLAAYSELLMDYHTLPEVERVNAVNVIRDEVERAAALINNLLNISRLESGSLPVVRQRVKVHDLLRGSFESMSKSAQTKGVALELKIPPELGSARLDKDLFRIAIDNLLGNAIKYSDSGDRVTLSAEYLEDRQMRISVKDQGIGIPAQDRDKVFRKYYRSDSEAASTRGGHGLGLYLAKQIVELHHGKIGVSSGPEKGTTFTVEFEAQHARLEEVPQA